MSLVNFTAREITCKIVYYGPGRSGKTTNLQYVYGRVPEARRGRMVSLATQTDRTLFFDFLPLELGSISGFTTKFQLYTVPGQSYYNATRKLVLQGADGVVFGSETSIGIVQLFFDRMVEELVSAAPKEQPRAPLLAENFEHELNTSLKELFGR